MDKCAKIHIASHMHSYRAEDARNRETFISCAGEQPHHMEPSPGLCTGVSSSDVHKARYNKAVYKFKCNCKAFQISSLGVRGIGMQEFLVTFILQNRKPQVSFLSF